MKIVVLSGGKSTERNVSLSSGAKITNALRSKGYKVAYVDSFLGEMLMKIRSTIYSSLNQKTNLR
jgi:D-alanine-D-alanine ligase and related ATP-grasp enzymes